jgi:hypothetical protein
MEYKFHNLHNKDISKLCLQATLYAQLMKEMKISNK